MTSPLSRRQLVVLGLVVLLSVAAGGFALLQVGGRQGLFSKRTEVRVKFREAHDIAPGTAVRVRGVEAGTVLAVECPDDPADGVTVRMLLDEKYASKLFADATAQAYAPSPLGGKVIAILPGSPSAGPLAGGEIAAKESPDFTSVIAKLDATATDAQALLRDVQAGKGSLGKLVTDEGLYTKLTEAVDASQAFVKRADGAVHTVEAKAADVDKLVTDTRGAVQSAKQGTEAIKAMPFVRDYVVDADKLLRRSECKAEVMSYTAADLFENGTAILTADGKGHLNRLGDGLRAVKNDKAEVVVAAGLTDPKADPTAASELTRKQAEVVAEYLKSHKGLKVGWWGTRKCSPVGLGTTPSPHPLGSPTPPNFVQVVVFTPQ